MPGSRINLQAQARYSRERSMAAIPSSDDVMDLQCCDDSAVGRELV